MSNPPIQRVTAAIRITADHPSVGGLIATRFDGVNKAYAVKAGNLLAWMRDLAGARVGIVPPPRPSPNFSPEVKQGCLPML